MNYKVKAGKEKIAAGGVLLATATQEQLKELFLRGSKYVEQVKTKAKAKKKTED